MPAILELEEEVARDRSDEVCFASILEYFDSDIDLSVNSATICVDELFWDAVPFKSFVIDSFKCAELADCLPDHLISVSGFIIPRGSQPKPFLAIVKANM